ncbi:hypothetical protein K1719_020476 [Acacia pycnantha]|nr:hypothetical protein K1719_020476 [Acacia pycnantha]
MERGGHGRGRSGHYQGGPRGRNGGRSGGEPPRGGGGRGFRHQWQPHNDRSWGEDTRRGGYGRGGFDRGGRGRGTGRNGAGSSVWEAGESSQSHNSAEDTRRGGYGMGGFDRGGRGRGSGRNGYGSSVLEAVPELEQLQISQRVLNSSHTQHTEIFPTPRPDKGGTIQIRTSKLRVNHFPIRFTSEAMLMHYTVDVKLISQVRVGRPQRISKSDLSMIRKTLFSTDTRLSLEKTVYDGEKNIFSAVPLPEETFMVTISASNSYQVTLTLVKELEYRKLSQYLNKESMSVPRDILQGMDTVFKENPAKRTIVVGRSFYPSNRPLLHQDLGNGIIALGGFQHSLKPTSQGLSLCLDYSVLSFRKPMPVLDFLSNRIYGFRDKESERFWIRVNGRIHGYSDKEFESFWFRVTTELIGLKVNVTHRRTRQKYTIVGLSDRDTRDITFPLKDPEGRSEARQVSIPDYFQDKYKKDIAYKNIPCLDFGEGVLVPMEFCILVEGQRYPKQDLDKNASETLNDMSLAPPEKHVGYKALKWISETEVGVVTQCCLTNTVNGGKDQNLTNLALKINSKLGGSNVELENRLPCFAGDDGHVMFIGADVNHPPARDNDSPSIIAVVGTVNWPAANRYAARVSPQPHRKEKILNFGTICLELVDYYAGLTNTKRHQTRLFREEPSFGNVSPGTVVDTKVVHPFEFDFYLCSHYGSLGTSKPTHYHVLWDEHKFTSDDIQKLIYYMCFTFARCTKPVSLVPPVYYADLVAYRGRLYYEAKTKLEKRASSSANEDNYFKLHKNLEDKMFFV